MLTEIQLSTLESFGRMNDGSYSDYSGFILRPIDKKRTKWKLYAYDEVDGTEEFLLNVDDFEDLKHYYFNITLKELV